MYYNPFPIIQVYKISKLALNMIKKHTLKTANGIKLIIIH